MAAATASDHSKPSASTLATRYAALRSYSTGLCRNLAPEDCVVQSMPDVSPTKWHLAHVTWFFEHFVLDEFEPNYRNFDDAYHYLFNSYYYSAGDMHARPRRGLLSRPILADILRYRAHVDEAMAALLLRRQDDDELSRRVVLGLNHERQHQELMLTDLKHVFSCNPLQPAVEAALPLPPQRPASELSFIDGPAGVQCIGHDGASGFCFDNETPRHELLLREHSLANRLVTNGEYREFIRDGSYREASLWLSDGWSVINERGWQRPLYWSEDLQQEFTLGGPREIDSHAPVVHISYYEADAFARWAGARLPLEGEWEMAAASKPVDGNLADAGYWHPAAGDGQWFGDAWEWTASAYNAYPGFRPLAGSLGEYNGKFVCNQMSVRGGSCVTSRDHIRATYRSFFYPDARWQFLGLRLARDGAGDKA